MTLQRKFALLLTVMGLAVAMNLAAAAWAVGTLERELSGYLGSVQGVLGGLTRVKRLLARVEPLVPAEHTRPEVLGDGGGPQEQNGEGQDSPLARFASLRGQIALELAELERVESYMVRSGASTWLNVRSRLNGTLDKVEHWLRTGDNQAREQAGVELFRLHELIERVEMKVQEDVGKVVAHGQRVRTWVQIILGVSVAIVVAAAVLGTALVRRWVVHPVQTLREAADRISHGDFSHRVPVLGQDELGMLSAEVNHMAAMISAMQEERVERERLAVVGEMVRRITHNLRNPLAGIRSLAELTRSDLPAESPLRENQDRIVQTVDRFERWLADLLHSSTPQAISPRPVAVAEWLAGVVETHRAAAAAKGVVLEVDALGAPTEAEFDPRHLEQAVVVVLVNAIQASPRGQPVRVSVRTGEDRASWEIRVTDRGAGVAPELMDKIFRPYFTTKREGTGIGLAFAKQVVEGHGGRILVAPRQESGETRPDGGSGATFVLRLPLNAGKPTMGADGAAVATFGQSAGTGAARGQHPDHRGRGEPAVLGPPSPEAGGA